MSTSRPLSPLRSTGACIVSRCCMKSQSWVGGIVHRVAFLFQDNSHIFSVLLDIVVCQSVVRGLQARKQVSIRRHDYHVASCVLIQSKWRVHRATKQFKQAKYQVTMIQAIARKNEARRHFLYQVNASTTISKCLRSHHCQMVYKRVIRSKLCGLLLVDTEHLIFEFHSSPQSLCK